MDGGMNVADAMDLALTAAFGLVAVGFTMLACIGYFAGERRYREHMEYLLRQRPLQGAVDFSYLKRYYRNSTPAWAFMACVFWLLTWLLWAW